MTMETTGHILITRYETGQYGTFGVLQLPLFLGESPPVVPVSDLLASYNQETILHTLEPPLDIAVALGKYPAIPAGQYPAISHTSGRFGLTWWLQGTEPRTEILFHPGNTWLSPDGHRVTRGCILLGLRRGLIRETPAILHSREAVRKFLRATREYQRLTVTIRNDFDAKTIS